MISTMQRIERITSDDEHRISSRAFYGQYHGHPASALGLLAHKLRKNGNSMYTERPLVWLCGDSSLDNKYWLAEGICKEVGWVGSGLKRWY